LKTVYLSLGSNLGDREAYLRQALQRLSGQGMLLAGKSSIYETDPQDLEDQPQFLNMVVEIETALFPMQLLSRTQRIERELGRERRTDKGPRTIDIDILFYGRFVIATDRLQIPHPRIEQRRFVLEPLAELAPNLRHPVSGKSVKELLRGVGAQGVRQWITKKEPGTGQAPG
jgi:2-amino-4-hydroxy-6-hydroxymethyldihydropteridine diphosphokinase